MIEQGLGRAAWEATNSYKGVESNDLPYNEETLDAMLATLPASATEAQREQMAKALLAAIIGENPWYQSVGRATLAAAYERLAEGI